MDKHSPLLDGQVPSWPPKSHDVFCLPRQELEKFRDNFAVLEQFAALVTGEKHPCLLDLLAWTYKQVEDGKLPRDKGLAAVMFFEGLQ